MTDSQPVSAPPPPAYPPQPPARTNWLMLGAIGFVVLCLSASIIVLAGLAGYNDGVRTVNRYAEGTRQADILRQYDLALTDVAAGNRDLAALRLEHVVITLNANVPDAAALLTQVRAATATPTPSPTPTVTPTLTFTATPQATPTSGPALPDPDSLFGQAQSAMTVRDYPTAIDTLTILQGVDANYQAAEVRAMLHEALTGLSRQYLTGPDADKLAEGILLAEQARSIAPIGDLAYESYIAGRYLDGLNAEGMECLLSVREWESVYAEAPQYRDTAIRLGNAYAACGDAYTYQTEYCPAEQYFRWALGLITDSTVSAKLADASEQCANATPTPTPTVEGVLEGATPAEAATPVQ